jgi:hypothetical protein
MDAQTRIIGGGIAGLIAISAAIYSDHKILSLVALGGITVWGFWPIIKTIQWRRKVLPILTIVTGMAITAGGIIWYYVEKDSNKIIPADKVASISSRLFRISPAVVDVGIGWVNSGLNLAAIKHGTTTPFSLAVKIKNLDEKKIVNINVKFETDLSRDKFREEIESSYLFPGYTLGNITIKIPVQFENPHRIRRQHFAIDGEKIKRIEELAPSGEAKIEYPEEVKNIVFLSLLSRAFVEYQRINSNLTRRAEEMKRSVEEGLDTKEIAKGALEIDSRDEDIMRDRLSILPQILITAQWEDVNGNLYSAKQTIRSVYQGSTPFWARNKDSTNLKLVGGEGQIGFENLDSPSDGLVGLLKSRGRLNINNF